MQLSLLLAFSLLLLLLPHCESILRPQESETREIRSLDGVWRFRVEDFANQGMLYNLICKKTHSTVKASPSVGMINQFLSRRCRWQSLLHITIYIRSKKLLYLFSCKPLLFVLEHHSCELSWLGMVSTRGMTQKSCG